MITFRLRAALTSADLAAVSYQEMVVVQASSANEVCSPGSADAAACLIDLAALLGAPAERFQFIEIEIELTPGTSGEVPVVFDWETTYSCLLDQ